MRDSIIDLGKGVGCRGTARRQVQLVGILERQLFRVRSTHLNLHRKIVRCLDITVSEYHLELQVVGLGIWQTNDLLAHVGTDLHPLDSSDVWKKPFCSVDVDLHSNISSRIWRVEVNSLDAKEDGPRRRRRRRGWWWNPTKDQYGGHRAYEEQ